eukprot:6489940-Amphidinium_carterae.1
MGLVEKTKRARNWTSALRARWPPAGAGDHNAADNHDSWKPQNHEMEDNYDWLAIADLMGEQLLDMDPNAGYGKAPRFAMDTPRSVPYTSDTQEPGGADTPGPLVATASSHPHQGSSALELPPTLPDSLPIAPSAAQSNSGTGEPDARLEALERGLEEMRAMLRMLVSRDAPS